MATDIVQTNTAATSRTLRSLLGGDLDFHGKNTRYSSHYFHSFPAKFPPQLPRLFIENLTAPGDTILDPMVGSGTTVLEAFLAGRNSVGVDIDPLALLISKVKTTPISPFLALQTSKEIVQRAASRLEGSNYALYKSLPALWDTATRNFVDYWFAPQTQRELAALIAEIRNINDTKVRDFFLLAFSATIITKSGGVSLAFDLGHTRPHKAKAAYARNGDPIYRADPNISATPRSQRLTKHLRSALDEFAKRSEMNARSLVTETATYPRCQFAQGDAQHIPLASSSVDLIVTSPPYASNAIDYMRAHKFSLVWFGHTTAELGKSRAEYIGGESYINHLFEDLPPTASLIVNQLQALDEKKARALHRYFSEMTRTLREMFRLLRPQKSAIVVVGSSSMRGIDTRTQTCLAEIASELGFEVSGIGTRRLDRDKRMLPSSNSPPGASSQIEQRMHDEHVIGLVKP